MRAVRLAAAQAARDLLSQCSCTTFTAGRGIDGAAGVMTVAEGAAGVLGTGEVLWRLAVFVSSSA